MCGIVGYSGKNPFNIDKIKLLMFWNSTERGKDSTGVFTPLGGVIKDADKADIFLKKNEIKPDNLLIGHVRAATSGKKTKENSHPFDVGSLIGVHNGTLDNIWSVLTANDLKPTSYDVDSNALYALMNKKKEEDWNNGNYAKILTSVKGPMALVWYDKVKKCLYVYRNDERPLYRGEIDGDMYISSIQESLEFIGCSNVKEFKSEYLYIINDGKIDEPVTFVAKYKEPVIKDNNAKGKTTLSDYLGCFGRLCEWSTDKGKYEVTMWKDTEWNGFKKIDVYETDFVYFRLNSIAKSYAPLGYTGNNGPKLNITLFVNGVETHTGFTTAFRVNNASFFQSEFTSNDVFKYGIPTQTIKFISNKKVACEEHGLIDVEEYDEKTKELSFHTPTGDLATLKNPSFIIPCYGVEDYNLYQKTVLMQDIELHKTDEVNPALNNTEIIKDEKERPEVYYNISENDLKDTKSQIKTLISKFVTDIETSSPNNWLTIESDLDADLEEVFQELEESKVENIEQHA